MTSPDKDRPSLFAVEIRSSRWDSLVAWYRDALGLEVLLRVIDDRYALLAAGSARLAILGRDQTSPESRRWSLAFEVEHLEAVRTRLLKMGSEPLAATANPEGFRECVVSDPDGNRIRLFTWNHNRTQE